MKKNKIFFSITVSVMLALVLFTGCTDESTTVNEIPVSNSRIKLKEEKVINGHGYRILEVDSIEFLVIGTGGVIRISK